MYIPDYVLVLGFFTVGFAYLFVWKNARFKDLESGSPIYLTPVPGLHRYSGNVSN
ncbi:hypothetical protein [Pectobacterium brasiliense]|uniref:hypothetical protein n=1 Tax=Pectobacterium brasiliense TaxID=180957 RepID=UPI000FA39B16|nr:hypothetical protein [Pectobacterium brasiliense]GKW27527.1 hypothetical protein PEC331060_07050 [Pectobacterium carotovorum subsp. carotovorum]QSD38913.1 hypothetical protein H5A37_17500 [Pectobacterium brasiliense]QSD42993.1 hypothetical protein H5A39_16575 [Pectobacterium brasiliense]QSD50125.1 hypothetical protein H5A25_08820 [Pectobacterium brasiliense]QSD54705.1 hypothetical protein H5A23_10560 [Pectobacterium brasiliense]